MITVHYVDGETDDFGTTDSNTDCDFGDGWVTIEVRDGLSIAFHWINTEYVKRIDSGTQILEQDTSKENTT